MSFGDKVKTGWEKLKARWGVNSNWQVLVIIVVFSITGSLTMKVSTYVLQFVGLSSKTTSPFLFWPLRILLITPIYQILLLFFGFISGQFPFFWKMEKKMLGRFGIKFDSKEEKEVTTL